MMAEGVDYELIPHQTDDESVWHIRILKGDFVETVFKFGKLVLNPKDETLKYSIDIVETPDGDLTVENEQFQEYTGEVLLAVMETLILKDGH